MRRRQVILSKANKEHKVLFLTDAYPFPPSGGAKIRNIHLIQLLAEVADLEILYFSKDGAAKDGAKKGRASTDNPQNPAIFNMMARPLSTAMAHSVGVEHEDSGLWRDPLSHLRPSSLRGYSNNMAEAIRVRASRDKIIWVSRLTMAQYIPLARRLGYRIIFDEHQIESDLLLDAAFSSIRRWHEGFFGLQCVYYERLYCNASHVVVTCSEIDASRVHKLAPSVTTAIVPNCVDPASYVLTRDEPGKTLFFPGTLSQRPNVEGLLWFTHEVLPRLRATLRDDMPQVVVAGANPSMALRSELEGAGIEVHADPPSMIPYLAEAALVFVPIHSGSGTRIKILEAMAAGRPIVTTGKGAEGLALAPSYDVSIADRADTFTTAIIRLLRDPGLGLKMRSHAIRTIEERYDWRHLRPKIKKLLEDVARVEPGAGPPST